MDVTDPTTFYFTQGVLGVTVVILAIVCIKLYNKTERLEQEKLAILEAWRQETKDEGRSALEIVKGNSQSLFYLADKIESGKKADRGTRR